MKHDVYLALVDRYLAYEQKLRIEIPNALDIMDIIILYEISQTETCCSLVLASTSEHDL